MPVVVRLLVLRGALALRCLPPRAPARAGDLIREPVVAELHHKIDAHAAVPVVVIVRLPERAERIDGDLVIVAKIPAERLDVGAIEVADRKSTRLNSSHR